MNILCLTVVLISFVFACLLLPVYEFGWMWVVEAFKNKEVKFRFCSVKNATDCVLHLELCGRQARSKFIARQRLLHNVTLCVAVTYRW